MKEYDNLHFWLLLSCIEITLGEAVDSYTVYELSQFLCWHEKIFAIMS